jgi:very-short-patch-repair endonuclease
MAAILLFRGDALASSQVAGTIWGMLDEAPCQPELTVVARSNHSIAGLTVHRASRLHPDDISWRRDMPVTSPARTLVDLAGCLDVVELENALAVCREGRLANDRQILAAIDRAPRHAGRGTLRRLLTAGGLSETRSRYERRLLKLIREAGLLRPLTNKILCGHRVDMVWHEQRLVVEFDGFRFHGDRAAFERDRRRDQTLVAAGYRVIRITARQLDQEPFAVIARLAAALA